MEFPFTEFIQGHWAFFWILQWADSAYLQMALSRKLVFLEHFKTSLLQWQTGTVNTYCKSLHLHLCKARRSYRSMPHSSHSTLCISIYVYIQWLFSDAQLGIHRCTDIEHNTSATAIIIYLCKVICILNFPPYLSSECGIPSEHRGKQCYRLLSGEYRYKRALW